MQLFVQKKLHFHQMAAHFTYFCIGIVLCFIWLKNKRLYLIYKINFNLNMMAVKLYIKNMVCPRCIKAVEGLLDNLGFPAIQVNLGEILLSEPLNETQRKEFAQQLNELGFELLDDKSEQLIGKIKSVIIQYIHHSHHRKVNLSELLVDELHKDYSSLSKLFSTTEGITIEQYIIRQKIEKVKELLAYNEMNLSEIADYLEYSSVAHLSAQFKKTTGLTPTQFKQQGIHLRKPLDSI